MTKRPVSFMEPPVQFIAFMTVTTPVPLSAPALRFTIAGETRPVPLNLASPPEMVMVLPRLQSDPLLTKRLI
jgi:hypothetical protein